MKNVFIHPTAEIESGVEIGEGSKIWQFAHLRKGSIVGENVSIGRGVFLDSDSVIGKNSKIQNYSQIFNPAKIEDEVFVGPGVILTNDKLPRATNFDGSQKKDGDWTKVGVIVRRGASIGAGSVCVAPLNIGQWSMIAAGSVVIKDVPAYSLVAGNPARFVRWISKSGERLVEHGSNILRSSISHEEFIVTEFGGIEEL